ncbi:MAG: hypothetical protein IPG96_18225 [Proteobacteria bacterium]|nr:hypothetical protein [Pseudomonadota bacterium]
MPARPLLYDKRLTDRFIQRGELSRDDLRKYLASLPDVASKGEPLPPPGEPPRPATGG